MTSVTDLCTTPNIVFDTDPGADDALALIWLCALHHRGKINLAHVTAVGGNVGVHDTWTNADLLLQLCQCHDVPLTAGLAAGGEHARHVHGNDGLAGLRKTIGLEPRPQSSRQIMEVLGQLETIMPAPTIIAVGPLTNLGHAVAARSAALDHARRIVVMGGALRGGNITAHAEFNVYHDPQSWAATLEHAPLDIITLDITQQVFFDAEITALRLPGVLGDFVHNLLNAMCRTSAERLGQPRFFVHDAVAVAAVCCPELLEFRPVELGLALEGGQRGALFEEKNAGSFARVAATVDAEALKNQLIADISVLCRSLA